MLPLSRCAAPTVGTYDTLAEAIYERDLAVLAVHGYDGSIAGTLVPADLYSQAEVLAARIQVRGMISRALESMLFE